MGSAHALTGPARGADASARTTVRALTVGVPARTRLLRGTSVGRGIGVGALAVVSAVVAVLAFAVLPALLPGWSTVAVTSGSMAPALRVGDAVVVSEPATGVPVGAVVLVRDPSRDVPLLHRVVEVVPGVGYRTRGDANPGADSAPVPPEAVLGVGRLVVPGAGWPLVATGRHAWPTLAVLVAALAGVLWLARSAWSVRTGTAGQVQVRVPVPGPHPARGAPAARHRAHGPRHRLPGGPVTGSRLGALAVVTVLGAAVTVGSLPPAAAAFSGATGNVTNALRTDSVRPVTGLAAAKSCPTSGPVHVGGAVGTATTTTFTVTVPAEVLAGDLLLLHLTLDTTEVTTPSGWTLFRADTQVGLGGAFVYQRLAGAGEAGLTHTWTYSAANGGTGRLHAVRGAGGPVAATFGVDWSLDGASGGSYGSVSATSVTPGRARSLLLVLLAVNNAAAGPTTPSGMTERGVDVASYPTAGFTLAGYTEALPTRTATGPRTSTIATSSAFAVHALVIRPVLPSLSLTWTPPADPGVTGLTVARVGAPAATLASLGPTATGWSSSSVPDGDQTYSVTSTTATTWRATAVVGTAWCS